MLRGLFGGQKGERRRVMRLALIHNSGRHPRHARRRPPRAPFARAAAAAKRLRSSALTASCWSVRHTCASRLPAGAAGDGGGGGGPAAAEAEVEGLLQRVSESRHAAERREALGQLRDMLQDDGSCAVWGWGFPMGGVGRSGAPSPCASMPVHA